MHLRRRSPVTRKTGNLSWKVKETFQSTNTLCCRDTSCWPQPAFQCKTKRDGWIIWSIRDFPGAQFSSFCVQRASSPISKASCGWSGRPAAAAAAWRRPSCRSRYLPSPSRWRRRWWWWWQPSRCQSYSGHRPPGRDTKIDAVFQRSIFNKDLSTELNNSFCSIN